MNIPFVITITFIGLSLAPSAYSQFVLNPVPGLPAVSAGSVAWGDYDNDGQLDFVLSGSLAISLWHNTGNGFSNVTATVAPGLPGLYDSSVAWGDFDNDGRLDLLLTGLTNFSGGAVSQVWRNTGNGFTNVPIPGLPQVAESSAAWIDFDGDGKLDFFISGVIDGRLPRGTVSQLWRNTGPVFTNVPIPGLLGAFTGSVAWGDYDNDGRPDFLISGITNSNTGDSMCQLWRNTGSGFTNVPIPGLRGMFDTGLAWADFDNDGRLDFIVQGLAGNTFVSEVWRNTGNGFTKTIVPGLPGLADGSLAWGDFNNDGQPDFVISGVTNGGPAMLTQIWLNSGSGFTNLPVPGLPGNFDNSLAVGDFNNDSRLDFLIAGTTDADLVSQIWRNTTLSSNSPPAAPGGLSATVSGDTVTLNWNQPADDHTPAAGLSYNVRVGTSPGGSEIVSAPALPNGRLLMPQIGRVHDGSAVFHQLRQGQIYYWSVQAVDSAFAGSPFAAEQQFGTPFLINSLRRPDGVFELNFNATPGASFHVLATTNLTLTASNWAVLGAATEISSGQYRFSDLQSTNQPRRFYRVGSP